MSAIQQAILAKKEALADAVKAPLGELAIHCAERWPDAESLDCLLADNIADISNCHLLYAWDVRGIEISSLVQRDGRDSSWRGRDLSDRPYLKNHLPFRGIMLSSVYQSEHTHKPCITALQAVGKEHELLGFIAADFAVSDLLRDSELMPAQLHWQQFRGDPAVRGTLFMQQRAQSLLDDHIDEVLDQIQNLMANHGIFHTKIHFSSGRCSFWLTDDPYNYRMHSVEEIVDPWLCLAYPQREYPSRAKMQPEHITAVLGQLKQLRFADDTIYLRSSSINIFNGLIGLTFSCDGSHYMPYDEFLAKNMDFWFGKLQ